MLYSVLSCDSKALRWNYRPPQETETIRQGEDHSAKEWEDEEKE
jgi:hypothetical protein